MTARLLVLLTACHEVAVKVLRYVKTDCDRMKAVHMVSDSHVGLHIHYTPVSGFVAPSP
jgi:hypothetical protein